jgi:hypothetical protein
MKKIVKLTESDLNRLVEKVLKEQEVADYMFFRTLNKLTKLLMKGDMIGLMTT